MGLLDGQRAVVTGGASGIGAATCRRFAAEGAEIAIIDVNAEMALTLADEIGGRAFTADVTDFDALDGAIAAAEEALGGITTLVNNAGASTLHPLADWPLDEWNNVINVNLTGTFHGFRSALPRIRAAGGGAIVSVSSISGTRPASGEAPYSAAKAAIAAITASAAMELAPEIRVNAVAPGIIRTALTGPLFQFLPELEEHYPRRTPAERIGEPEDVADVILFLCSDLARYVTGQNIVVDGGMTLHGSAMDGVLDRALELIERGVVPPEPR